MDIDIYFCDSNVTQAAWAARLAQNGSQIDYQTQKQGQPETGDIVRHIVSGGGTPAVKSKKVYESAAGKFVIIARG